MTKQEIKAAWHNGYSTWEILAMLISDGLEVPDAEWRVSDALGLDDEGREEMRDGYDNNV